MTHIIIVVAVFISLFRLDVVTAIVHRPRRHRHRRRRLAHSAALLINSIAFVGNDSDLLWTSPYC